MTTIKDINYVILCVAIPVVVFVLALIVFGIFRNRVSHKSSSFNVMLKDLGRWFVLKRKYVLFVILIIISAGLFAFVGIQQYTKKNYDVKIVTDSGTSFFIFTTTHKKYYLVDSSLGIKINTNEFDVKSEKLSDAQLQKLKEIEKADNKFAIDKYSQIEYYVFFYENNIFYSRYYGQDGPQISDEDWKDMQENIYKYNIDTKEIQQIRINKDELDYVSSVDVKLEALKYLYPKLEEAISGKCGASKNIFDDKVFNYGEVYYDKGRILFSTYSSGLIKGTVEYLYEYMPENNKTKRIASTSAGIVSVDIIR